MGCQGVDFPCGKGGVGEGYNKEGRTKLVIKWGKVKI